MIDVRRLAPELAELLRVFPAHPERAQLLTMYDRDPEDRPDWDAFEAFVRAHKRDRLAMPIVGLVRWNRRTIHGSFRRFAYFVPTILGACLTEQPPEWLSWDSAARWVSDARDAEAIYHAEYGAASPRDFTEEERHAMSGFFAAAVRETVHGPLPEQGLEVLECATRFDAYPRDVLLAWVALDDVDAEAALVHAIGTCLSDSSRSIAYPVVVHETVRASLEQRFLASTDPKRAAALSDAEAALSAHVRWSAPGPDVAVTARVQQ